MEGMGSLEGCWLREYGMGWSNKWGICCGNLLVSGTVYLAS